MALGFSIIDSTTLLNFEDVSTTCHFSDTSVQLNFEDVSTTCHFSDTSVQLNFELRDYMQGTIIYQVLIDWMETFSIGDIFIVES